MLEGSTTSKTTLWTLLVLIWFDVSPYSNQRLGKTIGPTTDHEDQLVKISSFFNTHTHKENIPWHELSQTSFYLPTLQVVVWLDHSSGVSNTDSWRMGGLEENQHDHELNIAVRWQLGNTSEKIFGKSRTTDMLLSSRTILIFRQDDMIKRVRDWIILTHWSKSAPEIRTR